MEAKEEARVEEKKSRWIDLSPAHRGLQLIMQNYVLKKKILAYQPANPEIWPDLYNEFVRLRVTRETRPRFSILRCRGKRFKMVTGTHLQYRYMGQIVFPYKMRESEAVEIQRWWRRRCYVRHFRRWCGRNALVRQLGLEEWT